MQNDFDRLRKRLKDQTEAANYAAAGLKEAEAALVVSEQRLGLSEEVYEILQAAADVVQQGLHEKISKVVSRCLAAVFPEPYEMVIEFERLASRTDARIRFMRDGKVVNPLTATGGGPVDVAAFALRMVCLSMETGTRKLLVLDEPFRFVSEEYRYAVKQMMKALASDLGVQIVMVTHIQEFRIGKVIEVGS